MLGIESRADKEEKYYTIEVTTDSYGIFRNFLTAINERAVDVNDAQEEWREIDNETANAGTDSDSHV